MIRKGAIQFPQLECSAMHYGKFLSFNPNPLYTFFAAKRISDTSQLQANSKITSAATTQYLRSCFSQSFHQWTCTLSVTFFPAVQCWQCTVLVPHPRWSRWEDGADEMCLQSPGPRPPANILSTPVLGWNLRLILASQQIPTYNIQAFNIHKHSSKTRKISFILFKNLMYSHKLSILWRVIYESRLIVWG